MICDQWDVVVVPFPFTDRPVEKRRPALALSSRTFNASGHTVLTMITTKTEPAWPGDTRMLDHASVGITSASSVRLKVFTLDNRLIMRIAGKLSDRDGKRVIRALTKYLHWPAA